MVKKKVIFKSEKKRIPVLAIIYYDNKAEPDLEFYNPKTKSVELMSFSRFVVKLFQMVILGNFNIEMT